MPVGHTDKIDPNTGKQRRGFAAMSPERRVAIAAKGGAAVPADKRTFSQNRVLAVIAGAKGGSKPRRARPDTAA